MGLKSKAVNSALMAAYKRGYEIRKHPALRFAGLQAYHGKAQHIRSAQERRDVCRYRHAASFAASPGASCAARRLLQ